MKSSRENEIPGPSSVNRRTGDSNNNPGEVGEMSEPFAPTSSLSTGPSSIDCHGEVGGMPEPSSLGTSVSVTAAGTEGEGAKPRKASVEASAYVKLVKDMFNDDDDKYLDYLDIKKGFKAGRIDILGVTRTIKELFKGHPELLLGCNAFLPKGYENILSHEEDSSLSSQSSA